METMKFLKGHWLGPWLVVVLCALILTVAIPQEAAATAVEYAVMLALIIVVCISALVTSSPGGKVVAGQFQTAAEGAALANSEGDGPTEISRLSKTIGAAEALMGILSSCDECSELRSDLQQIIGLAALLKSRALRGVGSCHPNGVIQGNEQCDPLAVPTGCPILTVPSFCNDECQCEITIP